MLVLAALAYSGCSLSLPVSLLPMLLRNDTAPDAQAVKIARPEQPAASMQPSAGMQEPPRLKPHESLYHWLPSPHDSGSRETSRLSADCPGSMAMVSHCERKPRFETANR